MQKAFLSDKPWAELNDVFLPKVRSRERPWADNRRVLEGILTGFLRPERAGATCSKEYPSASTCRSDAASIGEKRRFGSKCGGSFSRSWTCAASWIRATRSWTAVSPQPKGRLRRTKPSAALGVRSGWWWSTGFKVFLWKPTGLGQSGGSSAGGGKHPGANLRAARCQRPSTYRNPACALCRPGLRQRSATFAPAPAWHPS